MVVMIIFVIHTYIGVIQQPNLRPSCINGGSLGLYRAESQSFVEETPSLSIRLNYWNIIDKATRSVNQKTTTTQSIGYDNACFGRRH